MAVTWRVLPPQREFDELTAAGQFVPMMEITFEIVATGTQGTVRVPLRDYTVENVTAAIEQRAKVIAAVDTLG